MKEHQIGYVETTGSRIKFFVDDASGYMVSCGRNGKGNGGDNADGGGDNGGGGQ